MSGFIREISFLRQNCIAVPIKYPISSGLDYFCNDAISKNLHSFSKTFIIEGVITRCIVMPKFYVTTPIFYLNAKPHIGHAYSVTIADVLARWHRLKGDDTFFLTGTDEHGEKVEKKAAELGISPQEHVDRLSAEWKEAWKKLNISNDDFIRTTELRHEKAVKHFVKLMHDNGDIYEGVYEGWYCTSDETFIPESQLADGKCPECGKEVRKLKEETYYFRLSRYQEHLLEYYKQNPNFILPKKRAAEIINRVNDGLKDLSMTRPSVRWGIPFQFNDKHTIYVWVDALVNYLSAQGWPDKEPKYWPADVQIVGKDIVWFHTVIWPAMLISAGFKPPKSVLVTGHFISEGKKMSKSIGNVADPTELVNKYSADSLRYFLMRELPLGDDGDFSEKLLAERNNNELAADLGNLVFRVLTLSSKFEGKLEGKPALESSIDLKAFQEAMDRYDTYKALEIIWRFIKAANKYINDTKPWELQGSELANTLYNSIEAIRVIAILISPFMPAAADSINKQLGIPSGRFEDCKFSRIDYIPKKGAPLFKKIE